ncbi:hypothetical protein C0993_007736, partial [Termitomyces sp. T159_Od127]
TALDDLNKKLLPYDHLGQAPEQGSEWTNEEEGEEEERAAKIVVSDVHMDPKVKESYRIEAEDLESTGPGARRKALNVLLKEVLVLLATPFALAGTVIFVAGSLPYGVGSILKGLGNLITGGLLNSK